MYQLLFLDTILRTQRSENKFSLMGLDQSQEHSIKYLKEDSGQKGLYGIERSDERMVIELSKSEIFRIIDEFEHASFGEPSSSSNREHPEGSEREKNKFLNSVF